MKPVSLLKSKYVIGLVILLLASAVGVKSYRYFHRYIPPHVSLNYIPDTNLTTLRSGKTINIHKLRGKVVLLTIWASNCPTCIREIPHLVDLDLEYADKGLKIIAVAIYQDKLKRLRNLVESADLPYPVVYDRDKIIYDATRYYATPTSFLIDKEGRVIMTKIGRMNFEKLKKTINALLAKH
ncbi:MAG: TlpA disulfide reductase family protein [Gammaproteobacteria bacterium]|jgi:peroxiredoxin